jgi:hypothetical protein
MCSKRSESKCSIWLGFDFLLLKLPLFHPIFNASAAQVPAAVPSILILEQLQLTAAAMVGGAEQILTNFCDQFNSICTFCDQFSHDRTSIYTFNAVHFCDHII